jgi:hypothetical protein
VLLDFGLAKELPSDFRESMVRLTMAIMGGQPTDVARRFRRSASAPSAFGRQPRHARRSVPGLRAQERRGLRQPALMQKFNDELPKAMRQNPLVEVPGHPARRSRHGLLSGISKQLGSE